MAFESLTDRLQVAMSKLKKKGTVKEEDVKEMMREPVHDQQGAVRIAGGVEQFSSPVAALPCPGGDLMPFLGIQMREDGDQCHALVAVVVTCRGRAHQRVTDSWGLIVGRLLRHRVRRREELPTRWTPV